MSEFPDSVAIMVVDTKEFSRHNDVQQEELTVLIPDMLERASRRSGIEELWDARRFPDSTGDGYIIGFRPQLLPRVVDRYFDALQDELAIENPRLKSRDMSLRMRLSIELGPARVIDDERIGSPVGRAMIATHRLVDAEPLRVLLNNSDPNVTLLVVALSERVMEDAVRSGHTRRRVASEFVETSAEIAKKGFSGKAHLHVPAMSGDLLKHRLLGVQERPMKEKSPVARPARKAPPTTTSVGAVTGNSNVIGLAGHDLDQSRHETNVQGDQHNAQRDVSFRRDLDR